MRSPKAPSSSRENTSARLSKGTSWVTGAKVLRAVPPTLCVGESGELYSGCAASSSMSLRISASYSKSEITGASSS